jgi:hypothetical protein
MLYSEITDQLKPSKHQKKLIPLGFTLLKWFLVLALGSLLLYGRYNWDEAGGKFATKSYFSSLYFFLFVVPVSYYLILLVSNKQRLAFGIGATVFTIGCLPYNWLGLSRFRYLNTNFKSTRYGVVSGDSSIKLTWYPDALGQIDFPNEKRLFVLLLLVFIISAFLFAGGWKQIRSQFSTTLKRIAPLVLVFFVILIQMWLHTSLRSPYTYTSHFEQAPDRNYWYQVYFFDYKQGAANADVWLFTSLDDYFNGQPKDKELSTALIRRSFTDYISSNFSYFFSMFYVYLVLNSLFWFGAVLATYYYLKKVLGKPTVALYAAALVGCGTGFIYFAAQPMCYLAAYATTIVILYLIEYLLVQPQVRILNFLIFGVALGLLSCVYDIFPIYPMLLLYTFFRHIKFWKLLLSILLSGLVYYGFLVLQFNILGIKEVDVNSQYLDSAVKNFFNMLVNFQLGKFYALSVGAFKTYFQNLGYAFLFFGLIFAIIGLFLAEARKEKILLVMLFLPSLILNFFLYYSQVSWSSTLLIEIPRLSYIAYPAMYLAIALALYQFKVFLEKTRLAKLAVYAPWVIIVGFLIWHNIDVFGFPSLYFHFYWPMQYEWLN